jgi:hypothetical protein
MMAGKVDQYRQQVTDEFKKYSKEVHGALAQVTQALSRGEYALACQMMSAISQAQASASVQMRSTLVRHGFISREDTDD